MTELKPFAMSNVCLTPVGLRQMLATFVCSDGVGGGEDSLEVTTAGTGLDLLIGEGYGFITGDDDFPDQGVYQIGEDGSGTVTVSAASVSDPRIDLVVATIRDSDYGGTDDDW